MYFQSQIFFEDVLLPLKYPKTGLTFQILTLCQYHCTPCGNSKCQKILRYICLFHFFKLQFNFFVESKGFRTAKKRLKKDSAKVRAISSSLGVFMGFIRNERFSETSQVSCILLWVHKIFGITLKLG